jgi:FAD/FMN-containing dehydrogenase
MDDVEGVIDLFRQVTAEAPAELMQVLVLRIAPPVPFLPPEVHGKPVVGIAAAYLGDHTDGLAALHRVKSFGAPLVDSIKPKPFVEHQSFLDSGQPYGRRYYWKSHYLGDFSNGVAQALIDHATSFSSSFSSVLLPHLGGNAKSAPGGISAVGNRDAEFLVNYQASWEDPTEDERHIAWARENFDAMSPHASGQYVNFMTRDEINDPARQVYEAEAYSRLASIKRLYDPQNLFRLNRNVLPAA